MTAVGTESIETYHTGGSLTSCKQLLLFQDVLLWDCGLDDASGLYQNSEDLLHVRIRYSNLLHQVKHRLLLWVQFR